MKIERSLEDQRMVIYRERNRNIRAMGFKSYGHYLKSPLWFKIRDEVLRSKPDCVRCGKPATQVHHGKYRKKDLEGRDLNFLYSVCARCHHWAEFRSSDNAKLTPKQATHKLRFSK